MSKTSELSAVIDEMIECGNGLVKAATALKDFYSSTEETKTEPKTMNEKQPLPTKDTAKEVTSTPPAEDVKTYSKEDVRALLAQKANESDGKFKTVVKELVKKYSNGGTLKDIAPENYAALVTELEVATNG
jgi:hypothetical protein